MNVYFKKYTLNSNFFLNMKEFYNSDGSMKTNGTEVVTHNFKADDGQASIVVEADKVKDKNFMLVPSLNKVYKIVGKHYNNVKDVMLLLEQDFIISNYPRIRDQKYLVSRTSNFKRENFFGIDTEPIVSGFNERYFRAHPVRRKYALLTYQVSKVQDQYLGFYTYKEPVAFEGGIHQMQQEASKRFGDSYVYQGSLFKQQGAESYYRVTPHGELRAIVDYDRNKFMGEILGQEIPGMYITKYNVDYQPRLSTDVATTTLVIPLDPSPSSPGVLPFSSFLSPINGFPANMKINGREAIAAPLIDIKIVDSSIIKEENLGESVIFSKVTMEEDGVDQDIGVRFLKNSEKFSIELWGRSGSMFPFATKITDFKPFKTYTLDVYGERVELDPVALNKYDSVVVELNLNSSELGFEVVGYNPIMRTVLGSGSCQLSVRFPVSELGEFYAQNPMFEKQYNNQLLGNTMSGIIKSTGSGAAAGSFLPGVGTLIGAGAGFVGGAIGAGVDAVFSNKNKSLHLKSLAMLRDRVSGQPAPTLSMTLARNFGIGLYVNEIDDDSKEATLLTLYQTGLPSMYYSRIIDEINNIRTDEFEDYVLVCGSLVDDPGLTILEKNMIDSKLEEGVWINDY